MLRVRTTEDRTARAFGRFARAVRSLPSAWARAAETVEETAQQLAPVESGALVASIRSQGTDDGATVRAGGRGVVYAGVQHYGWPARNIRGTFFLTRAMQAHQDAPAREARAGVHRVAERVGLA